MIILKIVFTLIAVYGAILALQIHRLARKSKGEYERVFTGMWGAVNFCIALWELPVLAHYYDVRAKEYSPHTHFSQSFRSLAGFFWAIEIAFLFSLWVNHYVFALLSLAFHAAGYYFVFSKQSDCERTYYK